MTYSYDFPRPAVSVDIILFDISNEEPEVLLIQRAKDPFEGKWAFPGGFVDEDEDLIDAADRELEEETGLTGIYLQQFGAYGKPGRDPRGHTISVVYYEVIVKADHKIKAASDAADAKWFPVSAVPSLAFDHDQILDDALNELFEED